MSPAAPSSFPKKDYIHYAIALVIGLLIALLGRPGPESALTQDGVWVLAISIPILYLWMTADLTWTSLLFFALLGLTRVVMPVGLIFQEALGHFAVILVLVFIMLDGCLNETGAIKKVANWFITRKFVQGRPYAFLAMFFGANLFVGLFMQNLALAVMYLALTVKLCETIGVDKKHSLYKIMMLGTLWGNGVLSISSPIAKFFPNFLIGWIRDNHGVDISYAQWFAVGIPFTIIMFLLTMLVVRLIKPDVSPLMKFNVEEFKKEHDPPLGKRGKIAMIVFVILLFFILAPDIIYVAGAGGALLRIAAYFRSLGMAGPTILAILAIVVLVLIRAEGKPVLDIKVAVANVSLGFIIFFAAAVYLGIMFGDPRTGIGPWLGSLIEPVVGGMPPFAILVVLMVIGLILSQFMTNVVIVTLFITLGVPMFYGGDIGPITYIILVGFMACMSCATPPSVVTAALYYGPGYIEAKNVLKQNLLFLLFALIGVLVMTPIVMGIIGG